MVNRRRTFSWPNALVLTAMWLLLWGSLSPLTIIGGILASAVIMLVFPLPSLDFKGKFRPLHVVKFFAYFFADILIASIHVAWIAVRPRAVPQSSIIRLDLTSESDFILAITAEVISLIPGTVVVDASQEEHALYIHALGADSVEKIEHTRMKVHEQEHRIVAAIGTDDELKKFEVSV